MHRKARALDRARLDRFTGWKEMLLWLGFFIFIFPSLVEAARLEFGNLPARCLIRVRPSEPNGPEKQKGQNVCTMHVEKMGHVGPIENRLQKIKKDQ